MSRLKIKETAMRTFILVCVVALLVVVGMAFAVGLVNIAADHSEGKCVVSLTINTGMIYRSPVLTSNTSPGSIDEDFVDVKGKITAVRPQKNEFVVSENVKNWTFQLAKDGKVVINDRDSKLADLQPGDDATVTFDRQGQQLLASVVRATR